MPDDDPADLPRQLEAAQTQIRMLRRDNQQLREDMVELAGSLDGRVNYGAIGSGGGSGSGGDQESASSSSGGQNMMQPMPISMMTNMPSASLQQLNMKRSSSMSNSLSANSTHTGICSTITGDNDTHVTTGSGALLAKFQAQMLNMAAENEELTDALEQTQRQLMGAYQQLQSMQAIQADSHPQPPHWSHSVPPATDGRIQELQNECERLVEENQKLNEANIALTMESQQPREMAQTQYNEMRAQLEKQLRKQVEVNNGLRNKVKELMDANVEHLSLCGASQSDDSLEGRQLSKQIHVNMLLRANIEELVKANAALQDHIQEKQKTDEAIKLIVQNEKMKRKLAGSKIQRQRTIELAEAVNDLANSQTEHSSNASVSGAPQRSLKVLSRQQKAENELEELQAEIDRLNIILERERDLFTEEERKTAGLQSEVVQLTEQLRVRSIEFETSTKLYDEEAGKLRTGISEFQRLSNEMANNLAIATKRHQSELEASRREITELNQYLPET